MGIENKNVDKRQTRSQTRNVRPCKLLVYLNNHDHVWHCFKWLFSMKLDSLVSSPAFFFPCSVIFHPLLIPGMCHFMLPCLAVHKLGCSVTNEGRALRQTFIKNSPKRPQSCRVPISHGSVLTHSSALQPNQWP